MTNQVDKTNKNNDIQKIVFALCEGPHDIAFLYRIFSAQGFTGYQEIIRDFPEPIDSLIINALKSVDYGKIKLMEVGQKPIPSEILRKDNALIMLYDLGGDTKEERRKKLIRRIFKYKPDEELGLDAIEEKDFAISYFFDADDKGVDERLKEVEKEIQEVFDIDQITLSNGKPQVIKGFKIGCYIFAAQNGLGKLEDIILPMMEKGNETIFNEAGKFLELKDDQRLKKLKLKRDQNGEIVESRSGKKMKFDKDKSRICIAGQLQNSGKANTVIIKDCDYINLKKITDNHACRDIMKFISDMITD